MPLATGPDLALDFLVAGRIGPCEITPQRTRLALEPLSPGLRVLKGRLHGLKVKRRVRQRRCQFGLARLGFARGAISFDGGP
jgi:hypothetical protein